MKRIEHPARSVAALAAGVVLCLLSACGGGADEDDIPAPPSGGSGEPTLDACATGQAVATRPLRRLCVEHAEPTTQHQRPCPPGRRHCE